MSCGRVSCGRHLVVSCGRHLVVSCGRVSCGRHLVSPVVGCPVVGI